MVKAGALWPKRKTVAKDERGSKEDSKEDSKSLSVQEEGYEKSQDESQAQGKDETKEKRSNAQEPSKTGSADAGSADAESGASTPRSGASVREAETGVEAGGEAEADEKEADDGMHITDGSKGMLAGETSGSLLKDSTNEIKDGGDDCEDGGSDVEVDHRERINIQEETVQDVVRKIRRVDYDEEVLAEVGVKCFKTRNRSRHHLAKAQEEHVVALQEFRKTIKDPYDSQLASVVREKERALDRSEHILRQHEREAEHYTFGDAGSHKLAKALKHHREVNHIELPLNEIGTKGIKSLTALLARCSKLTRLNLQGNRFGLEGAKHLGTIIKRCKLLRELDVHDCALGAAGAEVLAKAAAKHSSLRVVSLRNNDIGPDGAVAVAKLYLSTNYVLEELDLSTNNIGGQRGAVALADALQASNSIKRLDLRFNNMDMVLRRPANRRLLMIFRRDQVVGIW